MGRVDYGRKVPALVLLGLGIIVLIQVLLPEAYFKAWELTAFSQSSSLIDPENTQGSLSGVSIENVGSFPAFVSSNDGADLPYKEFNISIPKINLPKTKVLVASNTFEHNLAQLPGTALPGEKGNVFITGHSSLPQFYNPTNFQAIFSNLPNIRKGDDILVDAVGQQYVYEVVGLRIVDPKETSVIYPPDNSGRYLTLMTCVPPGFNSKRLIVLTKMKES